MTSAKLPDDLRKTIVDGLARAIAKAWTNKHKPKTEAERPNTNIDKTTDRPNEKTTD